MCMLTVLGTIYGAILPIKPCQKTSVLPFGSLAKNLKKQLGLGEDMEGVLGVFPSILVSPFVVGIIGGALVVMKHWGQDNTSSPLVVGNANLVFACMEAYPFIL